MITATKFHTLEKFYSIFFAEEEIFSEIINKVTLINKCGIQLRLWGKYLCSLRSHEKSNKVNAKKQERNKKEWLIRVRVEKQDLLGIFAL